MLRAVVCQLKFRGLIGDMLTSGLRFPDASRSETRCCQIDNICNIASQLAAILDNFLPT